jgi:hypothetical protein
MIIEITNELARALASCLFILTVFILLGVNFFPSALPVVFEVVAMGMIGGFISIHKRLKDLASEDLKLMTSSKLYLYLAPFVGGLFAMILYLIFLSGLLQDPVFPQFRAGPDATAHAPQFSDLLDARAQDFNNYAKLLVWSFIAGFSEKFFVGLIGKFESTGEGK